MATKRDGDEAEVLEGRDLRAAVKQLSKGPMKFAFGFKDPQSPVLLMHKTISARKLANQLRGSLGGGKATHGTASADDQTLVLEVEGASIPGMEKMVKRVLREEKAGKFTQTRIKDKAGAEEDGAAEAGVEPSSNGSAETGDALLDELRELQGEIVAKESEVGRTLQALVTGGGGDAAEISVYMKLCMEFGQRARGCGDPELIEFAKTSIGRAKKASGVLARTAATPGAGAASPAAGAASLAAGAASLAAGAVAPGGAPGAPAPGSVPDGVSVEAGYGDNSGSVKKTADGIEVSFKHEKSLPLFAQNFNVWVIPCYTKGGLKAALEGTGSIGSTNGVKVSAKGAGTLELGIGRSMEGVTAGPYGSIELSASNSISAQCSQGASGAPDGWTIEPFTFTVSGTGRVGIKVEIENGGKLDVGQDVANWELFVVYVGRYTAGNFEFIDVRAGKDLQRLIAALEQAGPQIEQAVEKYAPKVVKEAAVDAAEWVAESDTAGDVADATGEVIQKVKEKTGVDAGEAVEEIVQSLVDENGETSAEATRRVNEENERFDASREDFHAVMEASGLNGELRPPWRTVDEYNAIWEVWRAESEREAKGESVPGAWRPMVTELVKQARQRKAAAQAKAAADKQAAEDKADAAVKAAVAAMEAARPGALGQGNVLNNRMKQTPNATGKQYFDKGWKDWSAAEAARNQAGSLSGEAKIQKAREATAAYERAKSTFTLGIQHL